jgi:hypothetical protein
MAYVIACVSGLDPTIETTIYHLLISCEQDVTPSSGICPMTTMMAGRTIELYPTFGRLLAFGWDVAL